MRTAFFLGLCVVLSFAVPGGASAQSMGSVSALRGTVISQPVPATDFSLIDQNGARFQMASTRGKIVVLSFIYTHCASVCPYVTVKIKAAIVQKEVGLFDSWHFLTGSPDEVQKVWSSYGVGVHVVTAGDLNQTGSGGMSMMQGQHDEGLNAADKGLVMKIIREFAGGYMVTHSAPFWIVDASGNVRAILNADASPDDIVTDVRALMHG